MHFYLLVVVFFAHAGDTCAVARPRGAAAAQ